MLSDSPVLQTYGDALQELSSLQGQPAGTSHSIFQSTCGPMGKILLAENYSAVVFKNNEETQVGKNVNQALYVQAAALGLKINAK